MASLLQRAYDASWGRLFAAGYDRALAASEEAGLRERRRELLARAGGRTVEIGAGTGLNLGHYTDAVTDLILTEPFGPMAERLRARVAEIRPETVVLQAPAERLPLDDDCADTVVVTLVLCTVNDVDATLEEIARVLRPGGRMLFLEHVRSPEAGLARWQDRLERPWKLLGHGCRANRDTIASIERSALEIEELERGRMPKAAAIVKPLAQGSALAPR